jgi:hypothetical protein
MATYGVRPVVTRYARHADMAPTPAVVTAIAPSMMGAPSIQAPIATNLMQLDVHTLDPFAQNREDITRWTHNLDLAACISKVRGVRTYPDPTLSDTHGRYLSQQKPRVVSH